MHPQWFAFVRERGNLAATCAVLDGVVLDVGCADAAPRGYLKPGAHYVGLDYSTATDWYGTRPDVFGDAQSLPFADASIDHALLLDVLEHLPDPHRCLAELGRVLKPGGTLTIQVPFMYPLHDQPLDFHRWTRYGLAEAASRSGFRIQHELAIGHPLETSALNANIAMSKTTINWIKARNPLALTVILLPFAVLVANLSAWLIARLGRPDDLMPYSYRMTWIRA